MRVAVVGASGRTGSLVGRMLSERGDTVRGLVRSDARARELSGFGVEPVVGDIGSDASGPRVDELVAGADALVFAAAGAGSNEQRAVDHTGVRRSLDAAARAGVSRLVLVSANGAHDPASWGPAYADYLTAKAAGERELRDSDIDWTIARPAALTSSAGTGRITLLTRPGGTGSIPREDVARTLLAVLDAPNTVGRTLELWGGDVPIDQAVSQI